MTSRDARIAVVGTGIVTVAGRGVDRTMDSLASGGAPPAPPRTIRTPLGDRHPVFEVADVAFDGPPTNLPAGRGRRGTRLALLAGLDALGGGDGAGAEEVRDGRDGRGIVSRSASPRRPDVDPSRFGVVVGATVGGMMQTEDWVEERALGGAPRVAARPAIRHLPLWEAPHVLARRVGARGPVMAVATACTSGTQAIASAAELIRAGVCDMVLAGGADALARVTYHGFASLGLLDRSRCRPFDPSRAGLNLGEGAAFLLLAAERLADAPLAWLDGWASTADAHHATAPRPDGSGLATAIRGALACAGTRPADVDWVHAHGTATQNNDSVEAEAISAVFGPCAVPVSSTKHVFGHTLGAAGAVSAVVAVAAMRSRWIPGNAAVADGAPPGVAIVPPAGLRRDVRRVVVGSMGFGGTNCALVLTAAGAPEPGEVRG